MSETEFPRSEIVQIVLSGVLFVLGLVLEHAFGDAILISAYLLAGHSVIRGAVKNVARGVVFDENFLLTVATLGAMAIHEIPEAVAVMLFFRTGEFMQDLAVGKSRRSIRKLLEIKPTYANLKDDGRIVRVKPEDVEVGSTVIVRPGEKIPVDGVVVSGSSVIDTSSITGEAKPKTVVEGDEVFSGTINLSGLLEVRVTKPFSDSTVSRILQLVEEAGSRKARTEKFITRFAYYYTPAVIALAAAIASIPPLVLGEPWDRWIYRALVLLVISCPCALVLSIPIGYFSAIGKAAKNGVLVKGANFIDTLRSVKVVAFDKTGTLTEGRFRVADVVAVNGFSREEVLKFAAIAEMHSSHPIAKSIVEAYGTEINDEIEEYREIAGRGVTVKASRTVVAGNDSLMHEMGIEHEFCEVEGTVVHVAIDGVYAGYITVVDEPKEDAKKAVEDIKLLGCRVVMLTGDERHVAKTVASRVGVDDFFAELLPEDKVRIIEEIREKEGLTAFAGDGINDAPVIARADVGIAMGGLGSEAAVEAADVVIMDDRPSKVADMMKLSRKTNKVVWENIVFAIAVKGFFITLGSLGMATMWEAVFADVGVTLIAVMNSMRILR